MAADKDKDQIVYISGSGCRVTGITVYDLKSGENFIYKMNDHVLYETVFMQTNRTRIFGCGWFFARNTWHTVSKIGRFSRIFALFGSGFVFIVVALFRCKSAKTSARAEYLLDFLCEM
ncbi:MAG: hypothetical protein J1F04_02050 [Oscillospiraceae bacterium]|nr:hypothetical protein [Oscillospiraceae bacterium]